MTTLAIERASTPSFVRIVALGLVASAAFVTTASRASAQGVEACFPDVGQPCASDEECQTLGGRASACVYDVTASAYVCKAPCSGWGVEPSDGDPIDSEQNNPDGSPKPYWFEAARCVAGELCVPRKGIGVATRHVCEPVPFSMDLNLLDTVVFHWVRMRSVPDLRDPADCSSRVKLAKLLDRNNDKRLDILDVDLAIVDFLRRPPCDPATGTCPCPDGSDDCALRPVFCNDDTDCGATDERPAPGLYCDTDLHRCARDCGLVMDERTSNNVTSIERECAGFGRVCDRSHGRCVETDVEQASCELDRDCPAGAYCLLGRCALQCFRATDCPSGWTCNNANRCTPDAPIALPFGVSPQDYAVQFAQDTAILDDLNDFADLPVIVMNKRTRQQEFGDSAPGFGYRLELRYDMMTTPACQRDPREMTREEVEACQITADREFLTLESPFGVVFASQFPSFRVKLNAGNAAKLPAGTFTATLTAIFSNGSRTSARIAFVRKSENGDYRGTMAMYLDSQAERRLARQPIAMRLYFDRTTVKTWDEILNDQHLKRTSLFEDVTDGFVVTGTIDGMQSGLFALPSASHPGNNEVPVVGLLSPRTNRMRLITAMDFDAEQCWSEDGRCCEGDACDDAGLQTRNPFRRPIRRVVEFLGPFDGRRLEFSGVVRETLYGLMPEPPPAPLASSEAPTTGEPQGITLDGRFSMLLSSQNDTAIAYAPGLFGEAYTPALPVPQLDHLVETACDGVPIPLELATPQGFRGYLDLLPRLPTRVFNHLVSFRQSIGEALSTLEQGGPGDDAALTLLDYLGSQVELAEACDDDAPGCVNERELRCGVALMRRAVVDNWIDLDQARVAGDGRAAMFCSDVNRGTEGCRVDDSNVRGLQEHNRLYRMWLEGMFFRAQTALSDAHYVLYTEAQSSASTRLGDAYDFKLDRLLAALTDLDAVRDDLLGTEGTALWWSWPARAFSARGGSLLDQWDRVLSQRMEMLLSVVDLRRRVQLASKQETAVFAQQVAQAEYLTQAYLGLLRRRWQGARAQFAGQAEALLDQARLLQIRADVLRNPLGLRPNNVYFFEGDGLVDDSPRANWRVFRQRVGEQLQTLSAKSAEVVQRIRASWANATDLASNLRRTQEHTERLLDQLCGPPENQPTSCDLDAATREQALACQGAGCDYEYRCESSDCVEADLVFRGSVQGFACRSDSEVLTLREQPDRMCMRGAVGSLIQQRDQLRLRMEQVLNRRARFLERLDRERDHITTTEIGNLAFLEYLEGRTLTVEAANAAIAKADAEYRAKIIDIEAGECEKPGSGSLGDCDAKALAVPKKKAAAALLGKATEKANKALKVVSVAHDVTVAERTGVKEVRELERQLDLLATQIDDIIFEYKAVLQQLSSVNVQIADTLHTANMAVRQGRNALQDVVDNLVGREPQEGAIANAVVAEFEGEFHQLLVDTYKLVQAVTHRFNFAQDAAALRNAVFKAVTLSDVAALLDDLDERVATRCGAAGIDCDVDKVTKLLRISLREHLFPGLHAILDPNTGDVLSEGQQFDRILRNSFRRRRLDSAGNIDEQFVIPLDIWMHAKGAFPNGELATFPGLSDSDCGHVLMPSVDSDGTRYGTWAVSLIGVDLDRIGRSVQVELQRGQADHMRSCDQGRRIGSSSLHPVINTYTVGTLGQDQGKLGDGLVTTSGRQPACVGADVGPECFHPFARDRSLGAPDWKVVIPDLGKENRWLFDWVDGARPAEIHDIILFLRYSSRPMSAEREQIVEFE